MLLEIETIFKNTLAYEQEAQMFKNQEKNGSQKSCDTVPIYRLLIMITISLKALHFVNE